VAPGRPLRTGSAPDCPSRLVLELRSPLDLYYPSLAIRSKRSSVGKSAAAARLIASLISRSSSVSTRTLVGGAPMRARRALFRAVLSFSPSAIEGAAGRCLSGNWMSQKKDESGKDKATDQNRPIPHIKAKESGRCRAGCEL
jgi:hypothetical protein